MNKQDGENKIKDKIDIKKENKIKYDFIQQILKNNIGNLIDDFLSSNIKNTLNKYLADSFTRWAIIEIKKSEEEIIQEFEKIISEKYKLKKIEK